jgi:predicted short-subunit dehydrogenase-like oxidoreductase (DUF2520 family)
MKRATQSGETAGETPIDVAILGLGNWGSSLAAALTLSGVPLCEVVVRRRRASSPYPTVSWKQAVLDARILWLCLPDAAILDAARRIAGQRGSLKGQIVVHSSGALSAEVLDPVRRAGATVASVHPVMSFPSRRIVPLPDMLFAVEAARPATRRKLHSLIHRLGGRPFDIAAQNKALYHAAGTLASPLLVSALAAAIEAARLAGLDRKSALEWVQSLAQATASNVFAHGPAASFSGPFARGDAETVRLHLQALREHPQLTDLYRSLALYAMEALPVRNERALFEALREVAASKSKAAVQRRNKPAPA